MAYGTASSAAAMNSARSRRSSTIASAARTTPELQAEFQLFSAWYHQLRRAMTESFGEKLRHVAR